MSEEQTEKPPGHLGATLWHKRRLAIPLRSVIVLPLLYEASVRSVISDLDKTTLILDFPHAGLPAPDTDPDLNGWIVIRENREVFLTVFGRTFPISLDWDSEYFYGSGHGAWIVTRKGP